LEMKQNGNHPVSSISCEFRQGNLHQGKGNCESFPRPCGMPRYIATSRIMGLFPLTFGMEVVLVQVLARNDPHGNPAHSGL